jgi:hypothetical protein
MNLYLPIANLREFQKGLEFFGIKVYNNLQGNMKQLSNNKNKFKKTVGSSHMVAVLLPEECFHKSLNESWLTHF